MPESRQTANDTLTLLSVSRLPGDHARLHEILSTASSTALALSAWTLHTSDSLNMAVGILSKEPVAVVICETELGTGSWRELLDHVSLLADPPLVIVTSLFADDRLWCEALNLNCFDVIAKPFDQHEVVRILGLAWQHWLDRHGIHRTRTKQRKAASATGTLSLITPHQ